MASESSDKLAPSITAARRTDTPPRSIFDDYQSAYQSILSPGRIFTGTLDAAEALNSSEALSELAPPNNPFGDLSPTHVSRNPFYGMRTGSLVAPKGRGNSRLPSSPKSKRRNNFSRPMGVSPSTDQVARPASAVIRDSLSISNLGSPRRLNQDRKPNTKQPNLHGARGRVEKLNTLGITVKRSGDESEFNRRSTASDQDIELRSPPDVVDSGRGMIEPPGITFRSSPAGQPPTIPLPPDPSSVAARGFVSGTLSETSLYENTEELLNLTQPGGLAKIINREQPYHSVDSLGGRLNSEFSWVGKKGKASFRDLSTKELKQVRGSVHGQQEDLAGGGVDVAPDDGSYGEKYMLSDAAYQPPTADQQPIAVDELVKADAGRAQILSEHLATSSRKGPKALGKPDDFDEENLQPAACVSHDLQADAALDFGDLQSSSSRGVSLDVTLRDGPFIPGLHMGESSLASLISGEGADAARLTAVAKGKKVIRNVEDDAGDDLSTEADESEGGEWETVGESGMRSKLGTQASMGRDTSGSSLANVSSNESVADDRSVPSPWDPLRSHPVVVTPPTKAVVRQRKGHASGVQEPATVPRYAAANSDGHLPRKLNRITSSTPALTLTATPKRQLKRDNSPTYRHPTPLSGEHQNPFISSPPSVDVQNPAASFELSELAAKRRDKRQAIYPDSPRSLHPPVLTQTPEKAKSRLQNPFATQGTSSDKSVDGSYSEVYPTNLAVDGSSILNPNSPHTPKSVKSYTKCSIKRTKTFLTESPSGMVICVYMHD